MMNFQIRKKYSHEDFPWDLLLMADPSKEAIERYLDNAETHLAFIDNELVGVLVITNDSGITELKNITVAEKHRGKGIGKLLVQHAIEQARSAKASRIEVGTGNSSLLQLSLYQKCGFKIVGVEKEFFIKNYKKPIFENGIQCMDMIRLSFDLK
jgi:ribosomal protein S18 acetylase RimI-like enzyme